MKVPHIRNMYRKVGFSRAAGPQKAGFGYVHDGSLDTLTSFLAQPVFNPWRQTLGNNVMGPIVQFVLAADTGTAPLVGYQVSTDSTNVTSAAVTSDLHLMITRARVTPTPDIDLIALGILNQAPIGLRYDPVAQTFRSSITGVGPFTLAQLQTEVQNGAALTFVGVAPGTGQRAALDRDQDGILDGDEAALGYGVATAGCPGVPSIAANSEPRLGNTSFAVTGRSAPASGFGWLLMGFGQSSLPMVGVQILIDPNLNPASFFLGTDVRGSAVQPMALPTAASWANTNLFAQFLWLDACAPTLPRRAQDLGRGNLPALDSQGRQPRLLLRPALATGMILRPC